MPPGRVAEDVDLEDGRPPLRILRPASSEALIDEQAFAAGDEYLPYWAELWPSAVALARLVAREDLTSARVLELGCGLGLPALAAARAGARVTATDWAPDAITAATDNAAANGVTLQAVVADWREPGPLVARGPWDLVLAADVLYEARAVAPLLALLEALAAPRVLVADPSRATCEPFLEQAAERWNLAATRAPDRPMVRVHELRPRNS
ncbi:MAG: Methyltransferase type 12 [Solirubrobacterales bacterium]|nr:Methyltransferase type 12 [Solirubrobacterales bacterium]